MLSNVAIRLVGDSALTVELASSAAVIEVKRLRVL